MINPYNPNAPTDPRYYANREELLSTFKDNVINVIDSKGISKPVNIAVIGQWGIGKTSTLLKFKDILKNEINNAKVFCSFVSLKPTACSDADTFFAMIIETIFKEYQTTSPLPNKVKDFMRGEIDVVNRWKLTKLSYPPELERKQEIVTAINFKDVLLRFWDKLKANKFELAVIMIDDIHYVMAQDKGEILYDLRTEMQSLITEGALFMFIIAGPITIYPDIKDKAEPFTRLFERFDLVQFDEHGTKEQILKPLEVEKIDLKISKDVIKKIHEITGGHQYFVSLVMRDLLNKLNKNKITLSDFNKYYPDLINHFARIKFNDDFARASGKEKELLLEIAMLSNYEFSLGEIKTGGSSKTALLERLINKTLIAKVERGRYRLFTPLFAEYLRRKKNDANNNTDFGSRTH